MLIVLLLLLLIHLHYEFHTHFSHCITFFGLFTALLLNHGESIQLFLLCIDLHISGLKQIFLGQALIVVCLICLCAQRSVNCIFFFLIMCITSGF